MLLSIFLLCVLSLLATEANIDGAPESSCYRMFPFHDVRPQLGYPFYKFSVQQTSDSTFDVTLESRNGTEFVGFFISARDYVFGIEPMGLWNVEGATDFKARPCPNSTFPANGITHVANNSLTSVTATWNMDDRLNGTDGVFLIASVAKDFYNVYVVKAPLVEN